MAYTLSSGGSDWVNIKVLTIDQGTGDTTDLDDKLEYVKFSSLAWTHDHKVGFHHHEMLLLSNCVAPRASYCICAQSRSNATSILSRHLVSRQLLLCSHGYIDFAASSV